MYRYIYIERERESERKRLLRGPGQLQVALQVAQARQKVRFGHVQLSAQWPQDPLQWAQIRAQINKRILHSGSQAQYGRDL